MIGAAWIPKPQYQTLGTYISALLCKCFAWRRLGVEAQLFKPRYMFTSFPQRHLLRAALVFLSPGTQAQLLVHYWICSATPRECRRINLPTRRLYSFCFFPLISFYLLVDRTQDLSSSGCHSLLAVDVERPLHSHEACEQKKDKCMNIRC